MICTYFRKYCYGQIHFQNIFKWGQLGSIEHVQFPTIICSVIRRSILAFLRTFLVHLNVLKLNTIANFKKVAELNFILLHCDRPKTHQKRLISFYFHFIYEFSMQTFKYIHIYTHSQNKHFYSLDTYKIHTTNFGISRFSATFNQRQ